MMLAERAVKATVALKAIQETTASNELLDRGERVAEDLERTAQNLTEAILLANQFGVRPTLDLAPLKRAMTQLEKPMPEVSSAVGAEETGGQARCRRGHNALIQAINKL